jgi:hypothetical protein
LATQATLPAASGHNWGACFADRIGEHDDRRQRLVATSIASRRIARLLARFRQHGGHDLAHEASRVDRHRILRRSCGRLAVRSLEVRGLHERLDAGLRELGARHDGHDPGHRLRGRRVDRHDPGVRMWRAQECEMQLPGQRELSAKRSRPVRQIVVFHAANDLPLPKRAVRECAVMTVILTP